jgi:hypothetical protein
MAYLSSPIGASRPPWIARKLLAVGGHLATYNVSGTVSGIDDRSIIAILVAAVKEIAAKVSDEASQSATARTPIPTAK